MEGRFIGDRDMGLSERNLHEEISKQIRDQKREPLGRIEENAQKDYKNSAANSPFDPSDSYQSITYMRELYYYDRGSTFEISADQFINYEGAKEKSIVQADDSRIIANYLSEFANLHIGVTFRVEARTNILLNFDLSSPVNMHARYKYVDSDSNVQTVDLVSTNGPYGNTVGDVYVGQNINLFDLPLNTWIRLDFFIYSHGALKFFRETTRELGFKSDAFLVADITPPSSPTWDDSLYSTTVATQLEVTDNSLTVANATTFPWHGPLIADGSDVIQYHTNTATQLVNLRDIDSVHTVGTTITAGFAKQYSKGSTNAIAGVIDTDVPDNWTGINDQVYIELNWNNPTTDVNGLPIDDFGGVGIYEVEWEETDEVLSISSQEVTILGNVLSAYKPNGSIKVSDKIYTITESRFEIAHWSRTVITISETISFTVGDTIGRARHNLIKEITSGASKHALYTGGDSLAVGEQKYFALDAFDTSMQKNRSTKTSIRRVDTGLQSAPPTVSFSVRRTTAQVQVYVSPSYFTGLKGHTITEIEWYHVRNNSRAPSLTDRTTATYYNTVQRGLSPVYGHPGVYEDNIWNHFAVKVTNGAGYSVIKYLGSYQPRKNQNVTPTAITNFTTSNIITEFSTLSGKPYADEILIKVRRAINQNYDTWRTPVVVADLTDANPSNMVAGYETLAVRALYWGDCTVAGSTVSASTISGYSGSFRTDDSGLDSLVFIDDLGQDFYITANTANQLTIDLNGKTPGASGPYGILVTEDANMGIDDPDNDGEDDEEVTND